MKNFPCRIAAIIAITIFISSLSGCSKPIPTNILEETEMSSIVTIESSEITTTETEETAISVIFEIEVVESELSEETTTTETSSNSVETQAITPTVKPTNTVTETTAVDIQTATYVCEMCNQTFSKQSDLNNHMEVVHGYGDVEETTVTTVVPSPIPTSAPTPTPLPARLYAMANVTYTVDSWTEERGSWQDVVTYNVEVVQNNGENYIGQWTVSYDGGETVANNLSVDYPYCFHYSNGYDITLTTEPYTK